MAEEGPYRQAGGVACPACATAMLTVNGGGLACPRGCGEWVPQAVVDQQWGLVAALDGDAQLKRRVGGSPAPCPRCRTPMALVVHPGWQSQHCPTHGVWFVGKARAAFEHQFAFLIARHQANLMKAETLTTMLRAATAGDASAMQHVVHRILMLEARIEHLETSVADLAAMPR